MAILYIGALRFAGLAADVPSLPLDASLLGAIFDATDTLEKWVFNGSAWVEFVAGNPVTTKGDLFTFDTDDARLPVGTADQVLSVDAAEPTGLKWIDPPVSSPLTTKGDVYSFSTFDERLPVGTNGQVLSSDSLEVIGLKWIDPVSSPLTTKGDLFAFSTVDVRFPVGTDGQVLSADAAEVTGLKWVAQSGGAGSGITGLNPDSTILDYLTPADPFATDDYTTPISASASSEDGANVAGNAVDSSIANFWRSNAGINESIILNMGSQVNCYGLAYYLSTDALMTETQFQIIGLTESEGDAVWGGGGNQTIETFETYGSQATMDAIWIPTDITTQRANFTTKVMDFDIVRDNTDDTISFDMGVLSDTAWVLRFKQIVTAFSSGNNLSSYWNVTSAITDSNSTNNFLGFGYNIDGTPNVWQMVSGTAVNQTSPTSSGNSVNLGTGTWYWEIIRVNATDYTINVYDDNQYSNQVATQSATISGACTNLRYWKVSNRLAASSSAATLTGTCDDFQLFNGVNSVPTASEQIIRTIDRDDLTLDAWNFIRFNGFRTQQLEIKGSSGNSLVMSANELMVQLETDPPLTTKHGQFTINPTNSNLPLNGGDPTSSVIDDPATNSMTLNSTIEQADPATDAMVMWQEILDANNSVSHSKMKIDGAVKNVRWF